MLQLDVRRNSLLWILGTTFVIGVGVELWSGLFHRSVEFPSLVVREDATTQALKRTADSLMRLRIAAENAPININTATAAELERLEGIGPVLARHIVEYREEHGLFQNVEQLDAVSGIGPKRLEAIRDHCIVE